MPKARKTMFGGSAGYVGRSGKVKPDTFFLRTGVDMTRKTFSGLKSIKITNLNIRRGRK
jgi:hypothetical protein